jgi:hypothetical protein
VDLYAALHRRAEWLPTFPGARGAPENCLSRGRHERQRYGTSYPTATKKGKFLPWDSARQENGRQGCPFCWVLMHLGPTLA